MRAMRYTNKEPILLTYHKHYLLQRQQQKVGYHSSLSCLAYPKYSNLQTSETEIRLNHK